MLLNKRLDLDIANNRLRKAHEADQEARVSYNIMTFIDIETVYTVHISFLQFMFIIQYSTRNSFSSNLLLFLFVRT